MFFKNLYLFRLVKPFDLTPEQLDEQLANAPFRPCGPLEMGTLGFVPPLGKTGRTLVHTANGCMMICVRSEEKLLPGSVVREVVAEKVAEIEEEQMRKVTRKERDSIKDEVLQDLLPRAFSRSRTTYLYIDPRLQYLIVDSSSPKRAEEITVLMRKSLRVDYVPALCTYRPSLSLIGCLSESSGRTRSWSGVKPRFERGRKLFKLGHLEAIKVVWKFKRRFNTLRSLTI